MIVALAAALAAATPAASSPPSPVDFMNFTYKVIPCAANVPVPAAVRGGSFSYFDQKMGAGFSIAVESVKVGSLGAGTRQAAIVLSCEFPVGGTAAAYLYGVQGKSATFLGKIADANWGPDWGAGPSSIHITFANNVLTVDGCATENCSATALATYALRRGKLIKLSIRNNPK